VQNLVFTSLSFITYLGLALQAVPADLSAYKDVGLGSAFIATCFFGFRYFAKQLERKDAEMKHMSERKDAEMKSLTEQYIQSSLIFAATVAKNEDLISEVRDLIRKMN
jgi:deferrochelatase/peroxidase EfeB